MQFLSRAISEAQHLGETILNLDQWFGNLALVAILYSGVEPLVQFLKGGIIMCTNY